MKPVLYTLSEPAKWSFAQVVDFVRLLDAAGHTARFSVAASDVHVLLPAEMINFAKQYLLDYKVHESSEGAKAIIQCATCGGGHGPRDPDKF